MPTFGPVLEVARLIRGFPRPWYIAGGWAIVLFLGRETREHDDIDVAILRNDQAELRTHLAAWAFEKVVDGQRLPWPTGNGSISRFTRSTRLRRPAPASSSC